MKVQFVRTPPKEYSAYIEGETADLPDADAAYLRGLGIVATPRAGADATTQHISDRTEIVGADNQTEVVISGRGANIAKVMDPASATVGLPGESTPRVSDSQRLAASKEVATGLVLQEANRTSGVVDETKPALSKSDAKKGAEGVATQSDEEKAAAKEAAAKAARKAPETK